MTYTTFLILFALDRGQNLVSVLLHPLNRKKQCEGSHVVRVHPNEVHLVTRTVDGEVLTEENGESREQRISESRETLVPNTENLRHRGHGTNIYSRYLHSTTFMLTY